MRISANIPPQQEEARALINPKRGRGTYGVSVIGTLTGSEQIQLQRPLVIEPDPENDAHWTVMQIDDVDSVLRVGHDAEALPTGTVLRIYKPVTVNEVGVSWV